MLISFTSIMRLSLVTCVAALGLAKAQFQNYINGSYYPNEQKANTSMLLSMAQQIAGADLYPYWAQVCLGLERWTTWANLVNTNTLMNATEVFQGVYFVGQAAWSSWAINTGEGFVIIDTLNSADEAKGIIVAGLEKLGFSGSDIKTVIITHEHFDHYNGAPYLQQTYHPKIGATATCWDAMAKLANTPTYDANSFNITEGQKLTIGNFTMEFFETPGHTNGTLSMIFPVKDPGTGRVHMAGLHGGSGFSATSLSLSQQAHSYERFAQLAEERGVDVLMSNHNSRDRTIYHLDVLEHRECAAGICNMPHPFVMGVDAYKRWCQTNALCVRANAARKDINLVGITGIGQVAT